MIVSIRANGLVCKIENRTADRVDFRHIDNDNWKTAFVHQSVMFGGRDTSAFMSLCRPTAAMYQLATGGRLRLRSEFVYGTDVQRQPRGYFAQIDAGLLETPDQEGFFPTIKIEGANPDFDDAIWPAIKMPVEGGMPKGRLNTIGGLTSRDKTMFGFSGRAVVTKLPQHEAKELHVSSRHLSLSVHSNPWLFPGRQENPINEELLSRIRITEEERHAFIQKMTEEALEDAATVRPKHTDYPDLSKDLRELRYNMMLTRNNLGLSQREDRAAIAKLAREIHTITRGPKVNDQEFWNIFDWLLEDPRSRIDSLEKIEYNRDLIIKLIAIKKKEV